MDELDNSAPPREVRIWTRVPGHQVIGRARAFCECGARQQARENTSFGDWREAHLREAWPILVPRRDAESFEDWMGRISEELVDAVAKEHALSGRDGLDRPIPAGGRIPVLSAEYVAASDRVDVLQHQMDEVRVKVLNRWDVSG